MDAYDPKLPISINNWPRGLKMPPLRRQPPAKERLREPGPQARDPPPEGFAFMLT